MKELFVKLFIASNIYDRMFIMKKDSNKSIEEKKYIFNHFDI